jgi:hypothetical protein
MRHAWWETVLFRAGIAWCAWQTLALPRPFRSLPRKHGIAVWFDVTFAGDPQIMGWLSILSAVCLLLYVLNIAVGFTLVVPLALSVAMGALENSQGAINHTTQIITLALFAQWLAAVWVAIRRRWGPLPPGGFTDDQLAADWTRQVIMSTYVVSALSKLVESHGLWFRDSPYIGLQIIKSMGMAKYGDTGPGQDVQWLAQFSIDHPLLVGSVIACALPLELFAFFALLNRRMALFFGSALLLFHVINTGILNLGFFHHKTLLIVLFINPVWWLVKGVQRRTLNAEH